MKISVVIPTYNSSKFIECTLQSVFSQKKKPYEIIVLDDGSADDTIEILEKYNGEMKIHRQVNKGAANARNALCNLAKGDYIAFLDHDDLLHPDYLNKLEQTIIDYPNAIAYITGHVDFLGYDQFDWDNVDLSDSDSRAIIYEPTPFLKKYNQQTGLFGSTSFICIPKWIIPKLNGPLFDVSGAEDSYLCTSFPLLGNVVYLPLPLIAYRIIMESQSSNRLKTYKHWTNVFELLEKRYDNCEDRILKKEFKYFFASRRRQYAKRLMAAKNYVEARNQLRKSICDSFKIKSITVSMAYLMATYLPRTIQPRWNPIYRHLDK